MADLEATKSGGPAWVYPEAKRTDKEWKFDHGVSVSDPYVWLEDAQSSDTKAWVQQQCGLYDGAAKAGGWDTVAAQLKEDMKKRFQFDKVGIFREHGGKFYIRRKAGLQRQSVLHVASEPTAEGLANAKDFINVNEEFPDGLVALGGVAFSEDGSLAAYTLSEGGSDWQTVRVRRAADGKDLDDQLSWVKYSRVAWMRDGSGFFYCRYAAPPGVQAPLSKYSSPAADEGGAAAGGAGGVEAGEETDSAVNQMVYFHRIGTPQSEDLLVHRSESQPDLMFGSEVTDDGRFLLISSSWGCEPANNLMVCDLERHWAPFCAGTAPLPFIPAVDDMRADWDYLASDPDQPRTLFFKTNDQARRNRVVRFTLPEETGDAAADCAAAQAATASDALVEVVPEPETDVLTGAFVAGGRVRWLVTEYLRDVCSFVQVKCLSRPELPHREVALPGLGTLAGLFAAWDKHDAFAQFTSYLSPCDVLQLQLPTEVPEGDELPALSFQTVYRTQVPDYDASEFESWMEFVTNPNDGTRIPCFLTRRRRAEGAPQAPQPTLLYGYGGFNIPMQPYFSSTRVTWMNACDGIFVVACIRGGSEYGKAWWEGGSRLTKTNCFDDFAAAADHLISKGLTTRKQLAIEGGSNGGLLVLATALRRPELFAAVGSHVAVTDLMRFDQFGVGKAWRSDFGHPSESKEDCEYALTYSPYHLALDPANLRAPLPATLLFTANKDDRVAPLHSYKFVAAAQAALTARGFQEQPLLLRVELDAGHGGGKPTDKMLQERAECYAFYAAHTGARVATD